jgi:hypothetical protein
MATDVKSLTKGWIEFLKNNQIVELKSDPETGSLKYRREVTSDDLARYLENTTDFGEDAISSAIHTVLTKKTVGKQPRIQNTPPPEKEPNKQLGSNVPVAPKKKYNTDDATDVEYRDINEAIKDFAGSSLGEADVEAVFSILAAPRPAAAPPAEKPVDQKAIEARKIEELNKIKRVIRDTMTDSQRQALWRILTDE